MGQAAAGNRAIGLTSFRLKWKRGCADSLLMPTPELLDAREVADWLHISTWTVYGLARSGVLPSIRIGAKCVRFDPNDVASFIEIHRTPHSSMSDNSAVETLSPLERWLA